MFPDNFNKSMCNAARELVENGWSVFPLSLGDKRPLAKWKRFQTEYASEDEIDEWETKGAPRTDADTGAEIGREQLFNLALVTGAISGIVVVDCDNEQAVEFAKSHGLTSPVGVKTRRGMHFYFRHPNNGRRFKNKAGNNPGSDGQWYNCPGLDFRGDGGYVVCPPSISLNPDGTIKHEDIWSFAAGMHLDDMPIWVGAADDMALSEGFDFATLSLEDAKVGESLMVS